MCIRDRYKERPDVRWRRIKKIEADLRKAEKTIAQSQKYLTMWRAESLDLNMAKLISSHDQMCIRDRLVSGPHGPLTRRYAPTSGKPSSGPLRPRTEAFSWLKTGMA